MSSTNKTRTSVNTCSDDSDETEVKDEVEAEPLAEVCFELEYGKEE